VRHSDSTSAGGASESMQVAAHPQGRLVEIRFAPGTRLTGAHGTAIVDALKSVMGTEGERFALFADAEGVSGTDADYRAVTGGFFAQHRDTARIALVNLSPIVRIVAEMFRVGIRLQMKTFGDEMAARAWLRTQGIGA
jgi:stage II sporulation SpoAA-like protein